MNNIVVTKEDIEEVMGRENRFPIDFEAGGPFGVSARASIVETKKGVKGATTQEEPLIEAGAGLEAVVGVCELVGEQLERWLSKLGDMPQNAFLLNNIGKTYLSKNDTDTALKYFSEALKVKKDFRPARANIIKAYILQGKLDDALAICLEDAKKYANDTTLLMNMAYLYLRRGEIEKAKEKLDDILTLDPRKVAAYHNRGVARLLSNRPNEAIRDFRKAISLDERSAQAYNALGLCYLLMNSYKKAIKNLQISLNIEETNIHVLKNLAAAYQSDKQFKRAADLMERHLLSYPLDSQARDIVALSYLNLKEYERCMTHLKYQLDKKDELRLSDADIARVLNNIGVVNSYFHRFEPAIAMYKASVEKCDESSAHITYNNLLKTYLTLGKTEVANSILDEYTRKGLKNNSPFVVLANYYYDNDEYIKSRDLLTSILERESDNILALQLLSSLYCEVFDDLDKSLELAKHAYDLRSSDQGLANNLAYYYARKGLISEAKDILENRRWDKDLFFAIATRGLVRLTEGYVNEGTNLYNQAEQLAWNTEWKRLVRQKKYIELGRHYLKIGKLQEAQHELNRALSTKSKKNMYRYQAEKLLAGLQQQQLM